MTTPDMRNSSRPAPERTADPGDRIKELLGPDFVLTEYDRVTYTWHHGAEELHHETEGGGSSHYHGSFHPGDGYCEGQGICRWCGRALHD